MVAGVNVILGVQAERKDQKPRGKLVLSKLHLPVALPSVPLKLSHQCHYQHCLHWAWVRPGCGCPTAAIGIKCAGTVPKLACDVAAGAIWALFYTPCHCQSAQHAPDCGGLSTPATICSFGVQVEPGNEAAPSGGRADMELHVPKPWSAGGRLLAPITVEHLILPRPQLGLGKPREHRGNQHCCQCPRGSSRPCWLQAAPDTSRVEPHATKSHPGVELCATKSHPWADNESNCLANTVYSWSPTQSSEPTMAVLRATILGGSKQPAPHWDGGVGHSQAVGAAGDAFRVSAALCGLPVVMQVSDTQGGPEIIYWLGTHWRRLLCWGLSKNW